MAHIAAPALLALQVAGPVIKGLSDRGAHRRDARIQEENARRDVLQGEREALNVYREERQQIGSAIAGASGGIGGSIGLIVQESARQAELEVERVRETAFRQAQNNKERARASRSAGTQALVGGLFNAVTSALGASSTLRTQRNRFEISEQNRAHQREHG